MEGLTRIKPAGSRACSAGSDPYLPIGIYAAAATTADHPRQEALRYLLFCFVCIKAEHIFHVHWPGFEFLRYVWGPEEGGTARLQSQGEGGAANPHRPVPQGFEPWTFGSKVQYPTPELPAPL